MLHGAKTSDKFLVSLGATFGVAADIVIFLVCPWQAWFIIIPVIAATAYKAYVSWVTWWKKRGMM
jgi:hypothetical protein